ncbi:MULTISPECIES: NAD-glutamate dehydrogenase domain-containing protein [unclassified Pseudodesulfovibrio]|uniref:NAD-glutamate dehydrogenase domain-containing protein n=1 Tax=unclassified Pseudodesulfovibrio TaxID=2661612 RepID=UPI000FEB7FC0|nr:MULTISPECIES: NAD-glutamate dehydrogenase domain-containing protein [unclassified Pseudodesulfovibrio]MCJ2164266.1 NAD-glutamate dehydrogenase [Pseudodesulfovibrio sp. S3-i]RWU05112.1 amino acid dehydrogenase [Pseudodesulfovibrio sp. S3]
MTENLCVDPAKIQKKVVETLQESAAALVPWFYGDMPEYYFLTHTEDEQIKHLRALLSGMVREEKQSIALHSPCGSRVTHISPGGDMNALGWVLKGYVDKDIQIARSYSSRDDSIRLDTLVFGPQPLCAGDNDRVKDVLGMALKGEIGLEPGEIGGFEKFLGTVSEDYIEKFEAGRAIRHFKTCDCVENQERVQVLLEKDVHPGFDRISIAMVQPPRKALLLKVVNVFGNENIPVDRAYSDEFERGDKPSIAIMSFYLDRERIDLAEESEAWQRLKRQLEMCKWFAPHGLEALAYEEGWELGQVMLMQAAGEFAHQFLVRKDLHAYTSSKIVYAILKHRDIAQLLFDYFDVRFNPGFVGDREEAMAGQRKLVRAAIKNVGNSIHRNILTYIFKFFRYTLRTNYYLDHKLGLSFRLDPLILAPMPKAERPFGVYCFHGPYSFAFQVRYRDSARGGVRVVRTWSQEQFEIESNRLFDEVTKLASAQQFKNKDIPEGGSKAVILLGPEGNIDLAVKSMVDSFLDLLVIPQGSKEFVQPGIVDYLGREEIIFLGPDENITSEHIQWIADRAEKRGYKWPSAFMSSKPGAGIAHKKYGVTSEGVIVFADELLRTLNIDPKNEPFTVKLTGGPAGDVASNVMRILMREYGDNARIVAMTDGHGAAYDPDGMDHQELIRLMDGNLKAADFDKAKLKGEGALVVSVGDPDGTRIRNTLHNTAVADLFIPSGGRPDTMNMSNWKEFLRKDGTPSAKGIVEGANIFISSDARAELERVGVLVVPGPSANKTGVICSSYEILAGLILNEAEFMEIKDEYIVQLLDILRARARAEARLLMREFKLAGGARTITQLSFELSESINSLADRVLQVLESTVGKVADDPELVQVLLAYCPAVLVEKHRDRVVNDIPRGHQLALLAAYVSAKMLYQEGMGWADRLVSLRDVREVVFTYLAQEKTVIGLMAEVREAGLAHADLIDGILDFSGRKMLTLNRLGLG